MSAAFANQVLLGLSSGEWIVDPGLLHTVNKFGVLADKCKAALVDPVHRFASIKVRMDTGGSCILGTRVHSVFLASQDSASNLGFRQSDLYASSYPELALEVLEWVSPVINEYLVSTAEEPPKGGTWSFRLTTAKAYYKALGMPVPREPPLRPKLSAYFGTRTSVSTDLISTMSLTPPTPDALCTTPLSSTSSTQPRGQSGAGSSSILSEILSHMWGS